jgi:hypothetical protein
LIFNKKEIVGKREGMNTNPLQQFRDTVYQALPKRADATMDLLDALTATGHVGSPVAVSESVLFRRQYSSVYDVLEEGELPEADLRAIFSRHQPLEGETIAGYEVYAVDCTPDPRPEAETLPERVNLKSQKNQAVQVGEKFSWLVRLFKQRSSWVAPQDIQRVSPNTTDSEVAVQQILHLDKQNDRLKVAVADSLYGNQYFLAVFLLVTTVVGLIRLRSNLRLYENPIPKPPKSKGRPRVHGPVFKLTDPSRLPDQTRTFILAGQKIRLAAWHNLHLRKLPALVGMVLRVEFLKADDTPRYKTPLYLFWTGPLTVPLEDLCRMYLWRFAIEHVFRFLKQHLGLSACRSSDPQVVSRWLWLVALAYWQLLLMAPLVADHRPAWRRSQRMESGMLTPGIVQRGALSFLLSLGTPAAASRPAGKGSGRPNGYRPQPKKRYPVVRKSQKQAKTARKRRETAV